MEIKSVRMHGSNGVRLCVENCNGKSMRGSQMSNSLPIDALLKFRNENF